MIRIILVAVFLISFLVFSIPILIAEWIYKKIDPHAADLSSLRIVQWAFRAVLRIAGTKITVIGEEHVPKDQAVLYVPTT